MNYSSKIWRKISFLLASFLLVVAMAGHVYSDVIINILSVNGTEETKEKEIHFDLPPELTSEDILDTAGLKIDYDVNNEVYFLVGKVVLEPKESKTFKIRVKDVWAIDHKEIGEINKRIDENIEHLKDTEFFETGQVRGDHLRKRLTSIVERQERFADNVEKRIDNFRIYSGEVGEIRRNALSVAFWRSKPPAYDKENVIRFHLEIENPTEKEVNTSSKRHYLPSEIKPEHVAETEGFDIGYDVERGQIFLSKDETLQANEIKKYDIGIVDIWSIAQEEVDNLKNRTKEVYKLLKTTIYAESASYLARGIKDNLERIEKSQSVKKKIKDHISAYRVNSQLFDMARKDVDQLEDLLKAIRADLERSILKNVLQKIKSLKSVADIAEAIFGTKPSMNTVWKIIIGIVAFVGALTFFHFVVWGKRSKAVVIEEKEEEKSEEEGKEGKEEKTSE